MPQPSREPPQSSRRAGDDVLSSRARILAALLLLGFTGWLYSPVLGYGFVALDDASYVVGNEQVRQGLSWEGVRWAFVSEHGGNWHPLTGISHMLDVQLFGLQAGGHHAVSVALHLLNTALLLGVLQAMTGRFAASLVVAALFALHPLHVESVAWVSERKDVLSTVFGLLALYAYVRFARSDADAGFARGEAAGRSGSGPRRVAYAMLVVCFIGSLLAKPMWVTLPFLLLLLDVWPLGRLRKPTLLAAERDLDGPGEARFRAADLRALIVEKLPLFGLAGAMSGITLVVQRGAGAMVVADQVSFPERVFNAAIGYVAYLRKAVWPTDLSVLVPHPYLPDTGGVAPGALEIVAAVALLAVLTLAALRVGAAAWVGWLWFLGTLVPVIGLVQVGPQGVADRYTYLPLVGLFAAFVYPLEARLRRASAGRARVVFATAGFALVLLSFATHQQIGYWRNSLTLYSQALAVNPRNLEAHFAIAGVYKGTGDDAQALAHFRDALVYRPNSARALNGVGTVLRRQGQLEEAARVFERVLVLQPSLHLAHQNLGNVRRELGQPAAAERHYRTALRYEPRAFHAHLNLAELLRQQGRASEALEHDRAAVALKPGSPRALRGQAESAWALSDFEALVPLLARLLEFDPQDAESGRRLERARAELGSAKEGSAP